MSLKFFQMSSMQLPFLPMLVIYPEENVVALTHLLCGKRVPVVSTEPQKTFLPIPRLTTPRNGH